MQINCSQGQREIRTVMTREISECLTKLCFLKWLPWPRPDGFSATDTTELWRCAASEPTWKSSRLEIKLR